MGFLIWIAVTTAFGGIIGNYGFDAMVFGLICGFIIGVLTCIIGAFGGASGGDIGGGGFDFDD